MKKLLSMIMIFILMFSIVTPVFAAQDYTFEIEYTGTVTANVQKEGKVILKGGTSSTPYEKVRIKISIDGPKKPVILARDSLNTQYNLAQIDYWGPTEGFAVNSATNNETVIQATFPEAGTYKITLSLVDVSKQPEEVITTQTLAIQVYEDEQQNNVISNAISDNNVNNTIGELPKTGTSVVEYAMYIIAITLIISIVGIYLNRKRMNV